MHYIDQNNSKNIYDVIKKMSISNKCRYFEVFIYQTILKKTHHSFHKKNELHNFSNLNSEGSC